MGTDEYRFWSDRLRDLLDMSKDDDYMRYLLHEQIQECYQHIIELLS